MAGAAGQNPRYQQSDPLPLIADPVAEDEIFNEGTSAPVISFSLVQGGLGQGSVDGGNNIDAGAALVDIYGADTAIGTADDDLNLSVQSEAIDRGSNAGLPQDRFDLDEDGNTSEPLPIDRAGNRRTHDGGTGSDTVDIGAYEFGASVVNVVEEESDQAFETYLSDPYPNPATNGLNVRFGIRSPTTARIVVFDAIGREVYVAYDDRLPSGRNYHVQIPTSSLASGAYFVRLVTEEIEISRQFVIVR